MQKEINIDKFFDRLNDYVNKYLSEDESLELLRFIDKLADSDQFSLKVSNVFNQSKIKKLNDKLNNLVNHEDFSIDGNFTFKWENSCWNLYRYNKLFLSQLDSRLTRKIVKDINVAILIKLSRTEKNK